MAICITFLAHWLVFRLLHIPLPLDRTSLFFVPLVTLAIGALAARPGAGRVRGFLRRALVTIMFVLACYFMLCTRLEYFKEWQWDAEVDRVYPVLAYYNRTFGITNFVSDWRYGSCLNFYHLLYNNDTIGDIRHPAEAHPLDSDAYILKWGDDESFIRKQNLRVVYRGEITDVVVAIRTSALRRNQGETGDTIRDSRFSAGERLR